jgi:nicotinate phosphoribosyltransferase
MDTPALKTDRYELSMLASLLREGRAEHRAVFECFARRLPRGRRYGVVAGLGRLLEQLPAFRFGPEEVAFLERERVVDDATLAYLASFPGFRGTIDAFPEGEVYFGYAPLLTVEGTLAETIVLETLVLSILNHDTAIASAACRMALAAAGRPLTEMGGRRTHEDAAVACARVAHICGFAGTSNLEAGRRYGIPTLGTAAHAFTLAHPTELNAFRAQIAEHGPDTTLLVDTYDVDQGIRNAIEAAGTELGAIRIDSGVLSEEAERARALLDELGATRTRILVTGDLDEYVISSLEGAAVDGFGVGTRLVTGSGHPTAGMVYKLVAIADEPGAAAPLRPVAKRAAGKLSVGGRKHAFRELDADGIAVRDVVLVGDTAPDEAPGRPLQVRVVERGTVVASPPLEQIRARLAASLAELPVEALAVADGEPPVAVVVRSPATEVV